MQGLKLPPHLDVLSDIKSLQEPARGCGELARIALLAASHLARVERTQRRTDRIGTNVFIGHGRSFAWRDLKDFINERVRLPWDEFNRVPVAGVTNIARLSEMLDAAAIALIIMTAEDEQADGKLHARLNVVHEAGLFQGRLGFTKAILLVEDGCEEFSNVQGLGQIRFPKDNIKAAFEEIRRVLEREGLVE
jgi:predicted nucleotide-binding protein